MASIELRQVSKAYATGTPVIRNVDLQIPEGEFCVFVGPSGCGKSTLLRMIAGLEEISDGTLLIDGKRMNEVRPAHRGVAMVFQSYALFPHLSVYENLAFGMILAKCDKARIRERVREVAAMLELEHLIDRKPKQLSGGQRQRVAIGRAIIREPGVFLFDEPLSNLDASLRTQTRLQIAKIHRDFRRASAVYVTHDQVEAMTLADRILLLNSGEAMAREGSVAQCGSPLELYHHPCNLFVAGFIGSPKMNFLPGTLLEGHADSAMVRLHTGETMRAHVNASTLQPGEAVTIGVRPEHIELGSSAQHVIREVRWQERLGDSTYLYLDSGAVNPLIARAAGQAYATSGQRLAVTLPADAIHVFDSRGNALVRCMTTPDLLLPVEA